MSANAAAQGVPGAPGNSAIGYQGMPPAFQSHPYISPYDNAIEQHFSSDGLWFRDTVGHFEPRGRRYTTEVQLEWLHTSVRRPEDRVGDPTAQILPQTNENFLLLPQVLTYEMYFPPNLSRMPTVRPDGLKLTTTVKSRDGWRFSFNGTWNDSTYSEFSAQADRDRWRIDELDAQILAATGGVTDPGTVFRNQYNTTDLEITETIILNRPGLPTGGSLVFFDAGDVEFFGVRESTFDILNRTLISQINLPLQTGEADQFSIDNPIAGVYQRFDIDFAIGHSVQTYGAGAHFETDTLFEHSGIRFRGLVGGRGMRINEGFHFRGTDSGLVYTVSDSPDQVDRIDNDGDFVVDDIEEGGTGDDYIDYNPSDELLIRAFVDNTVKSDLGGGEIGFAYDIGDNVGFSLAGSTRVGALYNEERIRLAGDNIGHFSPLGVTGDLGVDLATGDIILDDLFDTTTSNGPTQNAFGSNTGSSHLSPMFEQSLTANIPLFGSVPVLKNMRLLEHANLQLGWTFLWIGEVADPGNSTIWESNPRAGLFPSISVQRRSYYQNTFRLGVNCQY
ncbi:MAG: hypothetical protein ABGZ35_18190 [Planctomycetaceae bacterium]